MITIDPSDAADRIERFLDDYAACYRSRDEQGVVDRLCVPFSFLSDAGPTVMSDLETLLANFRALMAQYQRLGIVAYRHRLVETRPLSANVSLARVTWRFHRADDSLVYAADTSYFLLLEPAGIRIMAVLLHDEPEKKANALRTAHG
jgi:hypothetical protein